MKLNLSILFGAYVISWSFLAIGYSATASVGHQLAPQKALILLPLIMQVFGACMITIPASRLMIFLGRRNAFRIGSVLGMVGGLLCAYSVYIGNFWLLSFSTMFIGMYNGFGEFIKYAAADLFEDEKEKNRSISIIVSGGVVAAFIGPVMANLSNEYFSWIAPYVGPYILVGVLAAFSLVCFMFYTETPPADAQDDGIAAGGAVAASSRRAILTNHTFILGSAMGVLAFLIMSVMMDAFPITMMDHGLEFSHTTTVLQWHMLAMFAPSYFTSMFQARFGFTATASTGILFNLVGIAFALQGVEFVNFLGSLFFIGLGWNFMYLAGTSLIAIIDAKDRKQAEGYNNLLITGTYALAAPLSAFIVVTYGWDVLAFVSLTLAAIATLFVVRYRRVTVLASVNEQ